MTKTFDSEIKRDFEWVYRILKSCKTEAHFELADTCMELWNKKWSHLVNDRIYCYFILFYRSRYDQYKVKKNSFK